VGQDEKRLNVAVDGGKQLGFGDSPCDALISPQQKQEGRRKISISKEGDAKGGEGIIQTINECRAANWQGRNSRVKKKKKPKQKKSLGAYRG